MEQPPGVMDIRWGSSCYVCDICCIQWVLQDLKIILGFSPNTGHNLVLFLLGKFQRPKSYMWIKKAHGVQTNFELQVAGNRIENFTKTPLFSGSAHQGPGSIEQVRMNANQQRKSFQTTTSVTKTMIHNQGTSRVGFYFNQSVPFGFPWCSYPVQKNVPLQASFLCLTNKSAR